MGANYIVETFGNENSDFIVVNNYHTTNLVWNARISKSNLNLISFDNAIGKWIVKCKKQ